MNRSKSFTESAKAHLSIEKAIENSWAKIAPFWPLKNLIATNPMAGFIDLPFTEALKQAQIYFQQKEIPEPMQAVNRESIKWLQAFFDEGQATITMPLRHLGLLESSLVLFKFDSHLGLKDIEKQQWLEKLSKNPKALISETLLYLGVNHKDQEEFLTLMLTTLPGWAAYIQYRTNWADAEDSENPHAITQSDYLAFRLVITCLLWPEAKQLLLWHKQAKQIADISKSYEKITDFERDYKKELLNKLVDADPTEQKLTDIDAQLIFCIDVRSEPFRRLLEGKGNYQTYGFAGFFGLPVSIVNAVTEKNYASCPVLLKPEHSIFEKPSGSEESYVKGHKRAQGIKKSYQSAKYTFTTPFSLVETMGIVSGLWMALRSFLPKLSAQLKAKFKTLINPHASVRLDATLIPVNQQINYAISALKMIGITDNFAPLIVFCGHGSATENNAYATSLDCGACAGRRGTPNANILASLLNSTAVREGLKEHNIIIPKTTLFLAAEHNTTTDEVKFSDYNMPEYFKQKIALLKDALNEVKIENSLWRSAHLGLDKKAYRAEHKIALRAHDWAQVRPEWGLARNAAFIIGPRDWTKQIDLDGRAFLHSYNWLEDGDSSSLTTILTAPVIVAQWINSQYLFSTLDNIAFGGGSKVTKNITGKMGIMQGNASDLMHGLPLQSVLKTDKENYHQPIRLMVVVYAPRDKILPIVQEHTILRELFGNQWVILFCFEPGNHTFYTLQTNFIWQKTVL